MTGTGIPAPDGGTGSTANHLQAVVVKRGPNAGRRFPLDQPVTSVGRNHDSDIFLDDVTVGRKHAQLRRQGLDVHIVDLDSLNGTYVNDKHVRSAPLTNGDRINIGKFRLVFLASPSTG
ncbi:FHA domain-containing protein [Mycolicibacterium moriokaense]|nr:FHA domain-containing protein [Mycolicibacterium moriokaense]